MTQDEFTHIASSLRSCALSIAQRFGYEQADADDIAQDVMLRLWCLHEQIADETRLKALATIATRHVCIDRWRTAHIHTPIDSTTAVVDENTLYDKLEYAELEQWMNEQIDRLPSTSGIVLRMRQLERCELAEIADIVGIRQSSVSTLLSRARYELLNKLKQRNQR